jgi:hypothetical protein
MVTNKTKKTTDKQTKKQTHWYAKISKFKKFKNSILTHTIHKLAVISGATHREHFANLKTDDDGPLLSINFLDDNRQEGYDSTELGQKIRYLPVPSHPSTTAHHRYYRCLSVSGVGINKTSKNRSNTRKKYVSHQEAFAQNSRRRQNWW